MDIFSFLDEHGVGYARHDHPAVFTVEESERLVPEFPGAKTKNLFLRDDKGREHFLVVLPAKKTADLKTLAALIGSRKLGFASPERLKKHLGIDPGSVTILGLANDRDNRVRLVVDREIWDAEELHCHPLVNTATLVISLDGIRRFLAATGHEALVVDVPEK